MLFRCIPLILITLAPLSHPSYAQSEPPIEQVDVVLIGMGIMSATLGTLIHELAPELKMTLIERLNEVAAESSQEWNNAGTGHSGLAELNYSVEKPDGTIDHSKVFKTAESFEVSKQFWASAVERGWLGEPSSFINSVAHMSLVWGERDIAFLRNRFEAMQASPLFAGVEYSENTQQLQQWIPLIMQGPNLNQPMAATRSELGTDVNFGKITRDLVEALVNQGAELSLGTEVQDLQHQEDGKWLVTLKNLQTGAIRKVLTPFVFIGAGGGAFPLVEKAGIEEGKGLGGFPVSGQWLYCTNEEIIQKHEAKVYGRAALGAPPMSVPHLDTRIINGKKALVFGPFAGFSTRFLKQGSVFDLMRSVHMSNFGTLIGSALRNFSMVGYLVEQVTQSFNSRMRALRQFVPDARKLDWKLANAGQRVQIISPGGKLEFGTKVVAAEDGSLAALLGASPGASTAVTIMLEVLNRSHFAEQMKSPEWQSKLVDLIPSYGQKLGDQAELTHQVRTWSHQVLKLTPACQQLF